MSKLSKRTPLSAAVTAKEVSQSPQATAPNPKDETYKGNGVFLRASDWKMLRRVAEARVEAAGGGRPSMSKVIERLIDDNRKALESELV